jgi:hypothetical protein
MTKCITCKSTIKSGKYCSPACEEFDNAGAAPYTKPRPNLDSQLRAYKKLGLNRDKVMAKKRK